MTPRTVDRALYFYAVSALLGAVLCVALFGVRAYYAISFNEPLQLQTTGDEFSNYFNIWKAMNGEAVYTDRFQIPFSAAIYNWLFYYGYAAAVGAAMSAMSLADPWLPTVARFVTLAAVFLGLVFSYLVFARAAGARSPVFRGIAAAFAVFVMLGPLLGFWTLTVRADLWAMTIEIVGTWAFLAFYPKRRLTAILALAVAVYLAWSFKQGNVFAAAGAGCVLLCRRDWKSLGLLCFVLPAAWALTFALGEPGWTRDILFRDFALFFRADRLLRNALNVVAKTGPLWLFLLALAAIAAGASENFRRTLWANDSFICGSGAAFAGLLFAIPLAAQHGGGENYFFTIAFFLSMAVMATIPALSLEKPAARLSVLAAGTAGWVSLVGAIAAVFLGVVGAIDLRRVHGGYANLKRCTDTLPRPLFVYDPYMGLPWMTPDNTPWVLYFTYKEERALGRSFEKGGIGGMIVNREFAAIVVDTDTVGFDGAQFLGYDRVASPPGCELVAVYTRTPGRGTLP